MFDFFFVPPRLTFAVSDTEYLITFAVMLGIGLVISELTSRLKSQLQASQQQERRTAQLYRMTRQLSELSGTEFLLRTAGRQLEEIFDAEVVVLSDGADRVARAALRREDVGRPAAGQSRSSPQWVTQNGKMAGAGTDTLPNATALFVPLVGSQRTVGALGVRPKDADALARSRTAPAAGIVCEPDRAGDRTRRIGARRPAGAAADRGRAAAQFAA